MKKSIETIWKNAFLKNDSLVAPKVNNLYERKSIHIIDKFKRMFKINLIAIVIGSFFPLGWFIFQGIPYTGISLFLLLNFLVIVGIREMRNLQKIDKSKNSYHYLKAFDGWIKKSTALYTKIYTFLYPLLFLSIVLGVLFSEHRESVLNKLNDNFPDAYLVAGMPLLMIVVIVVVTGLLAFFGGALYRFDLNIVYGRVIRKLNEIITDMDELRS